MLLLSRYLLKNAALTTLFICVVLTLIIWLTQTLRLLDFVLNGGAPFSIFGSMLFLTIPRFFEIILPLSLALGILYALNKFSSDSELVVMQNSGLSPARLGRSLILFSLCIAAFIFVLSGWLTPMANREMDRLKGVVKSDYSLGLLRPGVFNLVGNDTTVYIAERTNLQDLKGVFIHTKDSPDEPAITITAENGGLLTQNGKPFVVVFDGLRQQFNENTGMVETLRFERYSLDLSKMATEIEKLQMDPNERTLPELMQSEQTEENTKLYSRLRAELHSRMSRPFLTVAFALISLVPFLIGRFNRRGHGVRVLGIVISLIVLQCVHLGASSFAVTSFVGLTLLYAVPVAIIVGYMVFLLNDGDMRAFTSRFAFKDRLI